MMGTALGPKGRYRLGEVVFDPEDGSLSWADRRVGLPPKQLHLLGLLVEAAPRLVTRERLLDEVWAGQTVFDATVTQTVKELRQALGDDAREPRFIETVARRGYRLMAVPEPLPQAAVAPGVTPAGPTPMAEGGGEAPAAGVSPRSQVWHLAVGITATLLAVTVGALWLARGRLLRATPDTNPAALAPPPRRAVAVLGFRDLRPAAESAWIATALTEFLATELAAGERLRVVSAEHIARVSREHAVWGASLLGWEVPPPVRAATAADTIVLGSYLATGQEPERALRVDVHIVDAGNGSLEITLSDGGGEAELLAVVGRLGAALRERLGVGALSPAEESALSATRLDSVEAARWYALGLGRMQDFNFTAARDFLERAVAAEPGSPLAHAALGRAWSWLGFEARETEEARKAWELSGELSRSDQLAIEAHLRERTAEWTRAIEIGRALVAFYPDDLDAGLNLALAQASASEMDDAYATLAALRELPPPQGDDPRIDLAEAWFSESDLGRKLAAADRAAAKAKATGATLLLAFARIQQGEAKLGTGRAGEALAAFDEAARIRTAAGDRWGVCKALMHVGMLLGERGELAAAEETLARALTAATEVGSLWSQAELEYELARVQLERGESDAARESLAGSLERFITIERRWAIARTRIALAELDLEAGDARRAEAAARAVAEECRAARFDESEAMALAVAARAALARGAVADADAAMKRATAIVGSAGRLSRRLPIAITGARVQTANGYAAAATAAAERAVEEAARGGLPIIELEARLALAEAVRALGRDAEAGAAIAAVADEAVRRGFARVARHAAALAR